MTAIVDIQGFANVTKEFYPKEIAVQCENTVISIVIKPPFPFEELNREQRKTVEFVERYKNIKWSEGFVHEENIKSCLQFLNKRVVFVKGKEKAAWLRNVLDDYKELSCDSNNNRIRDRYSYYNHNVHNLECFDCPPLSRLHKRFKREGGFEPCLYHEGVCAHRNVQYIAKWASENFDML